MSAQVIFLNRWINCPNEKRKEHDMMQAMINEEIAMFNYRLRELPPYQRALSKMRSHHEWRNRMKLIKNTIEEN